MGKQSAGLMMFRRSATGVEVFLVHPGGPYNARRDSGAWSVPKGEIEPGDEPLRRALTEFAEETGQRVEECAIGRELISLGSVVQAGGKTVHAWAFEGDWPPGAELESNTFPLEWPPRSGRTVEFPEVDRGEFFDRDAAREKINPAQAAFLDRLETHLDGTG